MKYLKKYKLFESVNEQEIHDTCKKYRIENYTINSDLSIDVDGNVNLYNKDLRKLPLNFRNVSNFYCSNNNLTILEGAPTKVGGDFYCEYNKLTSLEGAPISVGGNFYCDNNNLTSLEGAPSSVGGSFNCFNNNLINLKGASSQVGDNFYFYNNNLTSLEGLEWKSFNRIDLRNNPVYEIVKDWINNEDKIDLIEYFIDMNVIQEGDDKPKLVIARLEAFHDDVEVEVKRNFKGVKKNYEIIK